MGASSIMAERSGDGAMVVFESGYRSVDCEGVVIGAELVDYW